MPRSSPALPPFEISDGFRLREMPPLEGGLTDDPHGAQLAHRVCWALWQTIAYEADSVARDPVLHSAARDHLKRAVWDWKQWWESACAAIAAAEREAA